MAEYPDLTPDELADAITHAVATMRAAREHMALPARRRLLTEAADRLERAHLEASALSDRCVTVPAMTSAVRRNGQP